MTSRRAERSGSGRLGGIAACAALCLTVGSTALADSGAPSAKVANHCRADETILYACRFGKALGSVCGAPGKLHYRFGRPGRAGMDIASAPDWSNIRLGHVIGQGGGHQTHVRFSRGNVHYIVFEGVDGSLASRPGRRYSGIAVVQGANGERELATLTCRGSAILHRDFGEGVAGYAPSGDPARLAEQADGPFDGWY